MIFPKNSVLDGGPWVECAKSGFKTHIIWSLNYLFCKCCSACKNVL